MQTILARSEVVYKFYRCQRPDHLDVQAQQIFLPVLSDVSEDLIRPYIVRNVAYHGDAILIGCSLFSKCQ